MHVKPPSCERQRAAAANVVVPTEPVESESEQVAPDVAEGKDQMETGQGAPGEEQS